MEDINLLTIFQDTLFEEAFNAISDLKALIKNLNIDNRDNLIKYHIKKIDFILNEILSFNSFPFYF